MENLNREAILRMLSGKAGNSSSGGGGGGSVDLAGYATQIWTEQNYVSKEFFSSLFKAYDSNGNEVLPNDTETTINNIKAMFGFWTDQYLSALGQGSGGGGGGGAEALSDLLDVELTTLQNGQALIYSSALGKWTNGTAGVNMTQVWSALDSATNEQINVSHLTNALSGYVTTSAISDMATQTWVGQQGYATQTWVGQNYISIAYFDRLFQAYNGTGSSATRVNPNDTTSTIDNIKAMFGFWTELYLSSLGDGGASSGSISLGMLSDVTLSSPTDGQALVFDSTLGIWKNGTVSGTDMATVWTNLAAATNEQINASHLTDALLNYNPTNNFKTVNGNSIIGTGDINVGGGGGSYLPLSGGTMTGGITFSGVSTLVVGYSNNYTDRRHGVFMGGSNQSKYNASYMAHHCKGDGSSDNYITFGLYGADELLRITGLGQSSFYYTNGNAGGAMTITTSSTYDSFITFCLNSDRTKEFAQVGYSRGMAFLSNQSVTAKGRIGVNDSNVPQYWTAWNGTQYNLIHSGGGTITGTLTVQQGVNITGRATSGMNGDLIITNSSVSTQMAFGYHMSEYRMAFMQFNEPTKGAASANNSIRFHIYAHNDLLCIFGNGNVGVGTASPSYKLHVAGNIYATGGVTALSDARMKDVKGNLALMVDEIANAPAVEFTWKGERVKEGVQAGTLAQYWQKVLPMVVMDKGGELSMQYGVTALVSSIITARKVVDHERRIAELEKENKELKMKLKIA